MIEESKNLQPQKFERIGNINLNGIDLLSNQIHLHSTTQLSRSVSSNYGSKEKIINYFGLEPSSTIDASQIKAYQKEILSNSFDIEPYKEINILGTDSKGSKNSNITLTMNDWSGNGTLVSKGLLVDAKVKLYVAVDTFEIKKDGALGDSAIQVYSQSGWEDHWLRQDADGSTVFQPGDAANNDVKIDTNNFFVHGNIHRAIVTHGHNKLYINSDDQLKIDTEVDASQASSGLRHSNNAILIGSGYVQFHGEKGVVLKGYSDPSHKTFSNSFVIRGGDAEEDSCPSCTRVWDTEFLISSGNLISIDSNWGAIFMKSSSDTLVSGNGGQEISLGVDYHAKAILDAPNISITASGTSEGGLVNAVFRAESDNSKEALISLGIKNNRNIKGTDVLTVDYNDVLDNLNVG